MIRPAENQRDPIRIPLQRANSHLFAVEHLFLRLSELMSRDAPLDHHFAIATMFEVMDVGARADLKSDVLKDLDKQKQVLNGYRGNSSHRRRRT